MILIDSMNSSKESASGDSCIHSSSLICFSVLFVPDDRVDNSSSGHSSVLMGV